MTQKNRIAKLEGKRAGRTDRKRIVTVIGNSGRVEYGAPEYIGMTEQELEQAIGKPDRVVRVGVDMSKV